MATTLTSKGQVTIPKPVRDRLGLKTGAAVDFVLNEAGDVVLKAGAKPPRSRFTKLRGRATVKMRTEDILLLTRGG
ncbi:MAG: AbrB/MazE/SpoVT family DNA-binding domain-containing protein [Proteobacteria bacterium]|nr:AbrB/MazE/SpoVT family DNA-binding domain-containing protein [Pseudomonadota bacterium]